MTQAAIDPAAKADPASKKPGYLKGELWPVLRDVYGMFDRRTLGFTRLLMGFYLIGDLIRRTWDWFDMFSNEGVLPTHVYLWRPQSAFSWTLLNAFATKPELVALWLVIFATYVCFLIGYRTKLAQILVVVFVTSMNGRVLLIENGGYVVQNLLAMWTAFLPLGDRFSVDAMRRSLRQSREKSVDDLNDRDTLWDPERPDRHYTLLHFALLVQIAAIYYFNVIHKTGPAWKNGTAVHYVLYVDRMANPLIAAIRDYPPNWLIIFLTKLTLVFEATIPVALLSPLGKRWTRLVVIAMMNALHIAFGTTFVLGPFAWAACTFSTLLFQEDDWEIAKRTMRREHRARTVLYDPAAPGAFFVCRVLKRCDNLELLTFREEPGLSGGLAVQRADGSRATSRAALPEIARALPLGPLFAWTTALWGGLVAWACTERGARFFGLTRPTGELYLEPDPSTMSRRWRTFVRVLREIAIAFMFAAAINQALTELWVVNKRVRVGQPEPFRTLALKLRFLQGWFMFSPNPVMDDGTITVDAVTVDNRHIDPFTLKEPVFDLIHVKSFGYNQIWSDYFNRMHMPQNNAYRDAMRDYILRLPERTGNPNDAIVYGDVYWISDMNPKWNTTESYQLDKKKLFSFENKALPQPANRPKPDEDTAADKPRLLLAPPSKSAASPLSDTPPREEEK